jgi:hypothetical protein
VLGTFKESVVVVGTVTGGTSCNGSLTGGKIRGVSSSWESGTVIVEMSGGTGIGGGTLTTEVVDGNDIMAGTISGDSSTLESSMFASGTGIRCVMATSGVVCRGIPWS